MTMKLQYDTLLPHCMFYVLQILEILKFLEKSVSSPLTCQVKNNRLLKNDQSCRYRYIIKANLSKHAFLTVTLQILAADSVFLYLCPCYKSAFALRYALTEVNK